MGERPDLKLRHVVWPSIFAISLVAVSVLTLNENKFPPMMIALVASVVFAPLLATITDSGDKREHAFGVAVVCIPMAGFWGLGPNYFNIAIPFLIWIWQCASWSKQNHPPFRYGIWHGFGIASCILPGAMLIATLTQ
ncbi:MAG: hypothetical protein MKZ58_05950 [Candidatus Poseidoniaceae archaeon]|nr:hypothetical protein [Candidatus Poseidoniaceae archaeon]|tara:strand:- start:375 stop:785 length:411 start_codon:yes stop_codon:yes gene_type:complete